MNGEMIVKRTDLKPLNAIAKGLKSAIPAEHFTSHLLCAEPNKEIQIDFGGGHVFD